MQKPETQIAINTPIGTLVATSTNDKDYPGINISLVDKEGNNILLVLTEYSKDINSLRNILWDFSEDDKPSTIINLKQE